MKSAQFGLILMIIAMTFGYFDLDYSNPLTYKLTLAFCSLASFIFFFLLIRSYFDLKNESFRIMDLFSSKYSDYSYSLKKKFHSFLLSIYLFFYFIAEVSKELRLISSPNWRLPTMILLIGLPLTVLYLSARDYMESRDS